MRFIYILYQLTDALNDIMSETHITCIIHCEFAVKNHHMNLKGAVESLTERVKQMHSILVGMQQGGIRYDSVLVRSIADFADKLPAADQLVNFSREQEQAQRDSMLNTLLAVIMAGSASSMSL